MRSLSELRLPVLGLFAASVFSSSCSILLRFRPCDWVEGDGPVDNEVVGVVGMLADFVVFDGDADACFPLAEERLLVFSLDGDA